ncbi:WSC domain-containing protein, partial [Mycena sanguinolenta]
LTAVSGPHFNAYLDDVITTERIDPIVNPGKVSGHVHSVFGGSNFRVSTNTSYLRQSGCTSSPITEDKSNYVRIHRYPHRPLTQMEKWILHERQRQPRHVLIACGVDYLFSDTPGVTTPFPDDFRMLSGTPTLRSYNSSSFAQLAITFLCLDFSGTTTKFNELPAQKCPSGIRAQINFPSCWDGVNTDSADHKSHVAYLSTGPDSGTCSDPKYPKTLPRIFMEMYLDTASFDQYRDQAMNPSQPFVYAMGDPTGYGYHADFMMGWDQGVLDQVVNKCQCTSAAFGDPTCCSNAGYFDFKQGGNCRITRGVDEIATGTLPSLPGNNPVVPLNGVAANLVAPVTPALISPVYYYTGDSPTQTGTPVGSPVTVTGGAATTSAAGASTSAPAVSSSAKATSTKGADTTAK